jgi:hypothetical protein
MGLRIADLGLRIGRGVRRAGGWRLLGFRGLGGRGGFGRGR